LDSVDEVTLTHPCDIFMDVMHVRETGDIIQNILSCDGVAVFAVVVSLILSLFRRCGIILLIAYIVKRHANYSKSVEIEYRPNDVLLMTYSAALIYHILYSFEVSET
jgi:hypothetical protein